MIPSRRPDWAEILSGIVVFIVVGFGGGALIVQSRLDPSAIGLMLNALSGIAGLTAFAVAVRLRNGSLSAFGVRRASGRWLLIGAGVVAFVVKGLAVMAWVHLTGAAADPQDIFTAGASGSVAMFILSTLLMGVLPPISEEFLFRGVVTIALLRYGAFVGVVGGALIFALLHGINMIFPAALAAGLIAGEVLRRSGSLWPAVIVHVVFNLPAIPAMALAGVAQ